MAAKQGYIENNQKYLKVDQESQEKIVVMKEDEHVSTHNNQKIEMENQDDKGTEVKDEKPRTTSSEESLQERNLLLVVAVLIATVTYQAAVNPPPSIWKEKELDLKCLTKAFRHVRSSLLLPAFPPDCPAVKYFLFMIINTMTFSISIVSMFFLLALKFSMEIGKSLLAISIFSLLGNYFCLIMSLSPNVLSAFIVSIPIFMAMPFFIFLCGYYLMPLIEESTRIYNRKNIRRAVVLQYRKLCGAGNEHTTQ